MFPQGWSVRWNRFHNDAIVTFVLLCVAHSGLLAQGLPLFLLDKAQASYIASHRDDEQRYQQSSHSRNSGRTVHHKNRHHHQQVHKPNSYKLTDVEKWVLTKLSYSASQQTPIANLLDRLLDPTLNLKLSRKDPDKIDLIKRCRSSDSSDDINDPSPIPIPLSQENTISATFLKALLTRDFTDISTADREDAASISDYRKMPPHVLNIRFAVVTGDLDLEQAEIEYEVILEQCCFKGGVKLSNCIFKSHLSLEGSVFLQRMPKSDSDDPRVPFAFDNMKIGGGLFLAGAYFCGPVALFNTSVAGDLVAYRAHFIAANGRKDEYVGGCTANFREMNIGGAANFDSASFNGPVNFTNARVGSDLTANHATFTSHDVVYDDYMPGLSKYSVQFRNIDVKNSLFLNDTQFAGSVTLAYAHVGGRFATFPRGFLGFVTFEHMIVDTEITLADEQFVSDVNLEGLKYKDIKYQEDATRVAQQSEAGQMKLLTLLAHAYYCQDAYNTLEEYFKSQGQTNMANKVYFARKCREMIEVLPPYSKIPSFLLLISVGYGRYPILALVWSVLIVLNGWRIFASKKDMIEKDPKNHEQYDYSGFWYSLSLFLPLAELEASNIWKPRNCYPRKLIYMRIHILLGWLIIPVGIASISGFIK